MFCKNMGCIRPPSEEADDGLCDECRKALAKEAEMTKKRTEREKNAISEGENAGKFVSANAPISSSSSVDRKRSEEELEAKRKSDAAKKERRKERREKLRESQPKKGSGGSENDAWGKGLSRKSKQKRKKNLARGARSMYYGYAKGTKKNSKK